MRLRPRVSQTLRADLVDVVEATRRPMMNTVGPDAGEAASARERLEDHSGGEVMRAILRGLTPKDLVRAGGVNRKWRKLCEDESLWRSACESNPVLVALRARPTNLARRWKALFLQRAQAGQLRREAARAVEAAPHRPRSDFLIGIVVRERKRSARPLPDSSDLPEDGGTGRVIFSTVSELAPTGRSLYEPSPETARAYEAMSTERRELLYEHEPNMHRDVAVSAFLIRKSDDRMLDLGGSTPIANSLAGSLAGRWEYEQTATSFRDQEQPLESLANWRIEGIHTKQDSSYGGGFGESSSPEANQLWVGAALEASILADLPAGWTLPASHSEPYPRKQAADKRERVRRRTEIEQSLEFKGIRLGLLYNNQYDPQYGGGEEVWLDDVETFLKATERSKLWA